MERRVCPFEKNWGGHSFGRRPLSQSLTRSRLHKVDAWPFCSIAKLNLDEHCLSRGYLLGSFLADQGRVIPLGMLCDVSRGSVDEDLGVGCKTSPCNYQVLALYSITADYGRNIELPSRGSTSIYVAV